MQEKKNNNKLPRDQAEEPQMFTYVSPSDGPLRRGLIRFVENLVGRKRLAPLYEEVMSRDLSSVQIWGAALEALQLNLHYDEEKLDRIPREGPLVMIANHPFGVLDGLVLGHLAAKVRGKFHFLVHEALIHQDPRFAEFLLPVDFKDTKEALATNLETRKESLRRLAEGEALLIFPGGGVATRKLVFGKLQEFEWKRYVASVVQKAKATVVPIFFEGRNTNAYHLVSQVSKAARLGMQLHEIRKKMGKDLRLRIGDPIPYSDMEHLKGRQELLDFLYDATMALGEIDYAPPRKEKPKKPKRKG